MVWTQSPPIWTTCQLRKIFIFFPAVHFSYYCHLPSFLLPMPFPTDLIPSQGIISVTTSKCLHLAQTSPLSFRILTPSVSLTSLLENHTVISTSVNSGAGNTLVGPEDYLSQSSLPHSLGGGCGDTVSSSWEEDPWHGEGTSCFAGIINRDE